MESKEIKKVLYKEKPTATRQSVTRCSQQVLRYQCETSLGTINFKIPKEEAFGFEESIPAQLLIRWLAE